MPLDKPEMLGTEKDGSKSKEYCTYCYQNGGFVNPGMTLADMRKIVKEKMEELKIDTKIINIALTTLPNLNRWKTVPAY
jgi:radical SAM superfamily enzyme